MKATGAGAFIGGFTDIFLVRKTPKGKKSFDRRAGSHARNPPRAKTRKGTCSRTGAGLNPNPPFCCSREALLEPGRRERLEQYTAIANLAPSTVGGLELCRASRGET